MSRLLECFAAKSGLLNYYLKQNAIRLSVAGQYHTKTGVYGYRPRPEKPQHKPPVCENQIRNGNLSRWVTAYRQHGHRVSQLDPLGLQKQSVLVELDAAHYGLSPITASQDVFSMEGIVEMGKPSASLQELHQFLEKTYCGPMSAEFEHISEFGEREWFAQQYEKLHQEELPADTRVAAAKLMAKSQAFDHFVGNKFNTVKRYSGEGCESVMAFYDELFRIAANSGLRDVVMCIAHRGRLNLLSGLLQFPTAVMFRKMKGMREFPPEVKGSGDVLSHLSISVDLDYDGNNVHVSMIPNPSHLEAVNPVAVGKARGRQQTYHAGDYAPPSEEMEAWRLGEKVLCLQVHGDAAFSAQGVVAETFAIANLPHFTVGGSIHLIINNQLGFTTESRLGRSSQYSSDIAKMNGCPVIHVNAEYPEEVIKACQLAMMYRQEYHKDVVVDLICFRKWGHNELDDPSFTQPHMYAAIRNRQSIPDLYTERLVKEGLCTEADIQAEVSQYKGQLVDDLTKSESLVPKANHLEGYWTGYVQAPSAVTTWDTGVNTDLLRFIGAKSVSTPGDMNIHATLQKTHTDRRLQRMLEGASVDWSTAEALAIGSLLSQGFNVRLSGQDVGRATFSHRHAMLVDQDTDEMYIPLNHMTEDQKGFLEVANSALSEEAVLGFEYGMSVENPRSLVIWEAQFGDFFNGAQIIIDTFISGGDTKWLLQSGLVMLLPHGMDGAGPEHSSCRIERFLQISDSKEDAPDGDDVNMHIVNPTTPAQYFHLLRRQMLRNFRKPLVMVAPKVMLRLPAASSVLSDLAPGTTFQSVLPDPTSDPNKVEKVVFCTGQLYYTLAKKRDEAGINNMAIIRIESLCPFPAESIRKELAKYSNARDFIWCQEEHRNMGAWNFMSQRFENIVGVKLRYMGRDVHATPAAGVSEVHRQEAANILQQVFS